MARFSYTADMEKRSPQSPSRHLDVRAFARNAGEAGGTLALSAFARVASECVGGGAQSTVTWTAQGQGRDGGVASMTPWLHLHLHTELALVCQRCLEAVQIPVQVDQWYRFVPDEETAEQQDDDAPEDLLVDSPDFDLFALIEDELVLAMPLIARHDTCPTLPQLSAQDPGFDATAERRPAPFAALALLRKGGGELAD